MGRGPKKHMKRLAAPNHWMVDKLLGVYAPKCRDGPHSDSNALPLILILRNRLRLALTRSEAMMITKQRFIEIDGRPRVDPKYPVGFMDILSIPKTEEHFRILYDVKGRFVLQKIDAEEAKTKLLRVHKIITQAGNVPALVTHDGRTIRYADPLIKADDTIFYNLETNQISDFIKFKEGVTVIITGGANTGRVGTILDVERHPGSFNIVHVRDANGNTFATRQSNCFVIGTTEAQVTLPKGEGVRIPTAQDREFKIATIQKSKAGKRK